MGRSLDGSRAGADSPAHAEPAPPTTEDRPETPEQRAAARRAEAPDRSQATQGDASDGPVDLDRPEPVADEPIDVSPGQEDALDNRDHDARIEAGDDPGRSPDDSSGTTPSESSRADEGGPVGADSAEGNATRSDYSARDPERSDADQADGSEPNVEPSGDREIGDSDAPSDSSGDEAGRAPGGVVHDAPSGEVPSGTASLPDGPEDGGRTADAEPVDSPDGESRVGDHAPPSRGEVANEADEADEADDSSDPESQPESSPAGHDSVAEPPGVGSAGREGDAGAALSPAETGTNDEQLGRGDETENPHSGNGDVSDDEAGVGEGARPPEESAPAVHGGEDRNGEGDPAASGLQESPAEDASGEGDQSAVADGEPHAEADERITEETVAPGGDGHTSAAETDGRPGDHGSAEGKLDPGTGTPGIDDVHEVPMETGAEPEDVTDDTDAAPVEAADDPADPLAQSPDGETADDTGAEQQEQVGEAADAPVARDTPQPDMQAVADRLAAERSDLRAGRNLPDASRLERLGKMEAAARDGTDKPVTTLSIEQRPLSPTVERVRPDALRRDPSPELAERGFNEATFAGNSKGCTLRCSPSHELSQHSRFSPVSDPYIVKVRDLTGAVVWSRPMTHVAEQRNAASAAQGRDRGDQAFELGARAGPTAVGAALGAATGIPGTGALAKLGVDRMRPIERRMDVDRVTRVPFPHSRFAQDGYSVSIAEPAYAPLYREDPGMVRDLHQRSVREMTDRGAVSPSEGQHLADRLNELPWDGRGDDNTTVEDREDCRSLLARDGLSSWVDRELGKLHAGAHA